MSVPVYCKTCPPGTPTRLNRYTLEAGGEICGACERAQRVAWVEQQKAEAAKPLGATVREQILAALEDSPRPMYARELRELIGCAASTVSRVVFELIGDGLVERQGLYEGTMRYRLTVAAQDAA